jgi:hypothetical protein
VESQHNSVGIVYNYRLDDGGAESRWGPRILSARHSDRFWGPSSLLSDGYRGLAREAEHSLPTAAEVRTRWTYLHILSPIQFIGQFILRNAQRQYHLPIFYKIHDIFVRLHLIRAHYKAECRLLGSDAEWLL